MTNSVSIGTWELILPGFPTRKLDDEDEILSLVANLRDNVIPANAIATLVSDDEQALSVGLAYYPVRDDPSRNELVASVSHIPADGDPPYLGSVDPDWQESSAEAVFHFAGQPTEVSRRNCISPDLMLEIVRYFLEHKSLPDFAEWEAA